MSTSELRSLLLLLAAAWPAVDCAVSSTPPIAGIYSVKDYGAVGDGRTSDQAAVTGAIAACSAAGGGVVFAPAGIYSLSAEVDVPSNVRLQGSGERATIFRRDLAGLTGQLIIGLIDASDAVVADVGVDGMIVSADDTPNRNGIAIGTRSGTGTGTRCRAERCSATGVDNGFSIGGAITRCGIYDCHVFGSHSVGARVGGSNAAIAPVRCDVIGCTFTGGTLHGVYLTGGHSDCLVARNTIQTYGENGIQAYLADTQPVDALRCQLLDNRIDGCAWHGIYILDDNVSGHVSEGHLVRGNRITNAARNGIRLKDSAKDLVEQNWIEACGGHGISSETSGAILAQGTIILGNRVSAAKLSGIYVEGFDDGSITGNVILASGGTGIRFGGPPAKRGVVTGNTVRSSGGYGLDVYCADTVIGPNSLSGNASGDRHLAGGAAKRSDEPTEGSAAYDPPNLVNGAGATIAVTVTGASLGDRAAATFSLDLQGVQVSAWVSAADTVSVRFQNQTGAAIDLGAGTLRAFVFPR